MTPPWKPVPLERAEAILSSRRALEAPPAAPSRVLEAEGGCGVIGIASSEPVAGRHLLQALLEMRNRGNGKGGGIAAVGLDPGFFGAPAEVLAEDYLLAIAYLDAGSRAEVEASFLAPTFEVDRSIGIRRLPDAQAALGLTVAPP